MPEQIHRVERLLEVFEVLSGEDDVCIRLTVDDSKAFIDEMITNEFHIGANLNRSVELSEIDHRVIIGRRNRFICSSCLCQRKTMVS